MDFFKKQSLKTKIISSVLGAVVLVGAGSLASVWSIQKSYLKTVSDGFSDHARDLGVKIATQYYERYGDVQAFAVNQTIRNLDAQKMGPVLDQYVGLYGIYDLILVVDASGRAVAANSKDTASKDINFKALKGLDFSKAPWFKAVMHGETTDDKEKGYSGTFVEDFISDPLLKLALGEERYGSSFSTAIKDDAGKIIGVVTNRANSRWFEADLKPFYEALKNQELPTSQFMILNGHGDIVLDYDPSETPGKLDVVHDPKTLLKINPAKAGFKPAIEAEAGHTGSMIALDFNKGVGQHVVGYHKIENFKWPKTLAWTVFVSADEDDAFIEIRKAAHAFYWALGLFLCISTLIGFSVAHFIAKSISTVSQTMAMNANQVDSASASIANSASTLSEAATEQAAALQETVAAVDEITAMVEKNSEAAERSKGVSQQSRRAAEKGRTVVENVIRAIGDIDHANEEISKQIETSNRELSEITALINDIGSKTKVINEIVFQTKLLSFNASVEAARAGEYGKGFAVVAEEVGNLAQMSGGAAREITELLEASVRKVEVIVEQTKDRVGRLTAEAKEKVKVGNDVAHECNEALEEILENVSSVDTLITEIAVASTEQSTGIREISNAMGQMEQVTQQNTAVAQSSSVAATQLSQQSSQLNSLVQELSEIVFGHRAGQKTVRPKPVAQSSSKNQKTLEMKPKTPIELKPDEKQERPKGAASPHDVSAPAPLKTVSSDSVPSGDHAGFSED